MVLSSKELFTMGLRLDATTWLTAPTELSSSQSPLKLPHIEA